MLILHLVKHFSISKATKTSPRSRHGDRTDCDTRPPPERLSFFYLRFLDNTSLISVAVVHYANYISLSFSLCPSLGNNRTSKTISWISEIGMVWVADCSIQIRGHNGCITLPSIDALATCPTFFFDVGCGQLSARFVLDLLQPTFTLHLTIYLL